MKFPSLVLLKTWCGPSSFANLNSLAYLSVSNSNSRGGRGLK